MDFQIGWLNLTEGDGPDGGPKSAVWSKDTATVIVEEIPGKGKKDVTVRTSDGKLDACALTVRSITRERYRQLKLLCDYGGPYKVICNHGSLWMYLTHREITHTDSDKEFPLREEGADDRPELNVATWSINMQEAND